MQNEMPKLGDLFFAVCRTAIKNTSWKYAEFEKIKFVEGQLDALEDYFKQPAKTETADEDEGVKIELPNVTITPEFSNPMGQISTTAPSVDKDSFLEPACVVEPPVASEQEKKNS